MKVYQVYVTELDNRRSVQATYDDYDEANQHFHLLGHRMNDVNDTAVITIETIDVLDKSIIEHDYPTCELIMCSVCEVIEHDLRQAELAEDEMWAEHYGGQA